MMRRLLLAVALGLVSGAARAELSAIAPFPGGSSGQLQYNADFLFDGVPGSLVAGTTVTFVEIRVTTGAFGSGAVKSTFTSTGSLFMARNSSFTLVGPQGWLKSDSSVTASAFFGNCSGCSGIPSSAAVAAISARVTTLEVWQGTASVTVADYVTWKGTASPVLADYSAWKTTTSAQLVTIAATTSAIYATLASVAQSTTAVALSTAGLQQSKLSTGTVIPSNLVDLSTVNTRFNDVGLATSTHANLTGANAHGATSANTANSVVARDSLGNSSGTRIDLSSGIVAATLAISSGGVVSGPLTVVSTANANYSNIKFAITVGQNIACSTCGIATEFTILSSSGVYSPVWETAVASAAVSTNYNIRWSSAAMWNLILTGNTTFTFSEVKKGTCIAADLYQDGTGSRLPTFPTARWNGGTSQPTFTATGGKFDSVAFCYDGIMLKAYYSLNH
jgi:hypothetical protein